MTFMAQDERPREDEAAADSQAGNTPPPPSEPPSPEQTPGAAETSSDERTMAMLSHLLGIFTWFLGALLIWLIKKDTSSFIDDQGREALNFQITVGIAYIVAGLLTCVTLGLGSPLMILVWVLSVVFCILGAVEANKGGRYRYPFNIRIIK
jgi:hypothetical protein